MTEKSILLVFNKANRSSFFTNTENVKIIKAWHISEAKFGLTYEEDCSSLDPYSVQEDVYKHVLKIVPFTPNGIAEFRDAYGRPCSMTIHKESDMSLSFIQETR